MRRCYTQDERGKRRRTVAPREIEQEARPDHDNHENRTVPLLGHFALRGSSALDLLLRPQRKQPAGNGGGGVFGEAYLTQNPTREMQVVVMNIKTTFNAAVGWLFSH